MKFNLKAMALAGGLFWGVAILALASANLIWPGYGRAVLDWAASVYPGYHPGTGVGSVVTGTALCVCRRSSGRGIVRVVVQSSCSYANG